ncbi:U-box domain-containing protein 21-like [Gossypium australe]|uniref:U-box domain-containing protein n=1 Tax=Gossypium australe TaxID=47621 RepID=A0A5B6URW7_9ROSI|nr:U-box domain-containing protein 21-like [Gossypium australe]
MVFSWRKKKPRSFNGDKKKELEIPRHFLCPVTLDLMKDPVTLSSGITYDRESIEKWLDDGNFTCPVSNQVLRSFDQIPNHSLRKMIQDWCVENRSYGVERIPTPRIPVSSAEVSEVLFSIMDSTRRLDRCACLDSLHKLKKWGLESERNKRCIVANAAAAGAIAAVFDAFAGESVDKNINVLEEILFVINWMFPLTEQAQRYIGSQASLHCIARFLKSKDLSLKQNAITVLAELLSCNQKYAQELTTIDGINKTLFHFINNPICPSITKPSLTLIYHMVSLSNENTTTEFINMGLIPLLLEVMIDSQKAICEKALAIIDQLCETEQGRGFAYDDALAMPVLVKKILRVSELATEYSVSAIWKLSKGDEKTLMEALQFGAFQKLLLLIQVGCNDKTKEKATELLKLLNPYRPGLECIDSLDFKNIKRSF